MNLYITVNYVILAVLFTLLLVEGMSAMASLYDRKSVTNVKKLLFPIWAIIGTFAVFFIVNTEVVYPSIMPNIDYIYVFPILLATFLFIGRNVFIMFSEHIWKDAKINQLTLLKIYSFITLIIILILLLVFVSLLTGAGVNSTFSSFSIASFFSGYGAVGLIAGALLITFGVSFAFYGINKLKVLSPIATLLGVVIIVFSMKALNLSFNYITYILGAAIFVMSIIYYITGKTRREALMILLFLSLLSINLLNYGKVFGTKNLLSYINNSQVLFGVFIVTIIGGLLLVSMLSFFLYMYKKPDSNAEYESDYNDSEGGLDKVEIANLYIMPSNNKENGKEHKKGKNR